MTRKSKEDVFRIKKAIADIVNNRASEVAGKDNKPEQKKIIEILKSEYGLDATRQLVAKYLKEDLTKYLEVTNIHNNEKIKDIEEAMRVQKAIWKDSSQKASDRTKAANSWRGLHKQLIDYEIHLTETQLKKAEIERPNYLIKIEPRNIEVECPKCGHVFYDIDNDKSDKKDDKNEKNTEQD